MINIGANNSVSPEFAEHVMYSGRTVLAGIEAASAWNDVRIGACGISLGTSPNAPKLLEHYASSALAL